MPEPSITPPTYSPSPHFWAMLLACATFPLIWVGGLVTTYDAGMSVPDWPTTYGYNMFAYPWETWFFGPWDLFIEHGHRLLGSLVGFLTICFTVSVWLKDRRPWLKLLAIVALLAVIAQGVLGGMRVLFDDVQLAMIHGCFGPAFFCLTAALAVFTSRFWWETKPVAAQSSTTLHRWALLTLVVAYVQLVLGATLRHLPVEVSPQFFRSAVIFHVIMAFVVVGHVFGLSHIVRRQHRSEKSLQWPALVVRFLVLVQLFLGGSTWVVKYGWPSWLIESSLTAGYTVQAHSLSQSLTVTAHVAMGSLILAMAVVIVVRATRIFTPFSGVLRTDMALVEGGGRDQYSEPLNAVRIANTIGVEVGS